MDMVIHFWGTFFNKKKKFISSKPEFFLAWHGYLNCYTQRPAYGMLGHSPVYGNIGIKVLEDLVPAILKNAEDYSC